MISVAKENGSFLKTIPSSGERVFGFHRLFGFVSEESCEARLRNRKAHGLTTRRAEWLFRFKIVPQGAGFNIASLEGCTANAGSAGTWTLSSAVGNFILGPSEASAVTVPAVQVDESPVNRWFLIFAMLFFLLASMIWILSPSKVEEVAPPLPEPVTVQLIPKNSVRIPAPGIGHQSQRRRRKTGSGAESGFLRPTGQKRIEQGRRRRAVRLAEH